MSSEPKKKEHKFIRKIIDLALHYLEENASQPNAREFAGFIAERLKKKKMAQGASELQYEVSAADDLGIRLVLLNRYAKEYVKIALADTKLQTADEFPILMTLFGGGSHTKTELFNKMLLTKTTGTEILKRLKQKDLIVEYADSRDKRSKRVDVSAQGKKLVLKLLPRMSGVSQLISGNLTASELGSLNHHLKKLTNHHRSFFAETSDKKLQSIIRK